MILFRQSVTPALVLTDADVARCLEAVQANATEGTAGQRAMFTALATLVEARTKALWWRAAGGAARRVVSEFNVTHRESVHAITPYELTPSTLPAPTVQTWPLGAEAWAPFPSARRGPDNRIRLEPGQYRVEVDVTPDETPPPEISEALYRMAGWAEVNRPRTLEPGVAVIPTLAGAWRKSGAAEVAAAYVSAAARLL